MRYVLTEGKMPPSVFAFCESIGIDEVDFYKFFSSFEALESDLWESWMHSTLDSIKKDSNFESFSAREKVLAFYYTHLEVLKRRRSFVAMHWPEVKKKAGRVKSLQAYKKAFMNFANEVVEEGVDKGELKDRKRLTEQYDKAFWLQLIFVVDYWVQDASKDFEMTDAAVEKAVNLSFQLLGESALDSAIDFARFIWQSR